MKYKYGDFTEGQIADTKRKMRKQIFLLLLMVDPATAGQYEDMDIYDAFESVLVTFGGLNDLLNYPQELVGVMSMLDAAYLMLCDEGDLDWAKYRKLILDAGNEVLKIKEVD